MGNKGAIKINNNSSLTIYLNGNLEGTNGNGINNTGRKPADFKLFTTGIGIQTINLKNNTDFYGAVYAPNAVITLKNNPKIYGAITAKSFITQNNCNFYYDYDLRNGRVTDEKVHFVVTRWSE
jgi:predicted acyltransferase (DUF342 family)